MPLRRGTLLVGAVVSVGVLLSACGTAVARSAAGPAATGSPSRTPTASVRPTPSGGFDAPITVSLSTPTASLHTASLLKLNAVINSTHGWANWSAINWGDGTRTIVPVFAGPACPVDGTPPPPPKTPPAATHQEVLFEHRYRLPGRHTITVTAEHLAFCYPSYLHGHGVARITITVTGPAADANGPADPMPGVGIYSYENGIVHGEVDATDIQGYVRTITVTWPDGVTHTYPNPTPCRDPGYTWPTSQVQFFWTHRLPPGRWVIRATVTSTDCVGQNSQVFTDLRSVLLGSPNGWANIGRDSNRYLPFGPSDGWTSGAQGTE